MAGVMGYPVMHSRSPRLHNRWLADHGLQGVYVPLAVEPDGLVAALKALPALGFAGCNLTQPHKEAAIAAMNELDPMVARIGAMNCVVVGPEGRLKGYNNEALGYVLSIEERFPEWRADDGPIVVVGAGGGARAVVAGLADRGAREIHLVNRSRARAERLAADYGAPVTVHDWEERGALLVDAAMLVNTTNQGLHGQPPLDLCLDRLSTRAVVSDINYIPRESPLLVAARKRGNRTVNGLGMLLHQARPAFRFWFGIMPDVTPEIRAMMEASIA